jgi:twinkle protein
MEMPLHRQLATMCRQFLCKEDISEEELTRFVHWLSGRIYLLDVYGMVSHKQVMDLMEYARKRHGCDVAVIDSLMKLELASDDYELQRKITNEFTCFAQSNSIHLHIVAHPRKGTKESGYLGMLDVKGAQDVIAQPDNVLVVQRNKNKEKKASRGRTVEGYDAMITCDKQRATGHVFELPVKWHGNALQYTQDSPIASPNNYSHVIGEQTQVD